MVKVRISGKILGKVEDSIRGYSRRTENSDIAGYINAAVNICDDFVDVSISDSTIYSKVKKVLGGYTQPNLFRWGNFVSHSGETLTFKIDCDALTDDDITCIAKIITIKIPKFFKAIGIPAGGTRLANELNKYSDSASNVILIIDDVLTSGNSMEESRKETKKLFKNNPIVGFVIFNRSKKNLPSWINSVCEIK